VPCPARCCRVASGARPSCTCPAAGRGSGGCAGAAAGDPGGGGVEEVAAVEGAPGEKGESCGTCFRGSWSGEGEDLGRRGRNRC